MSLRFFVILRVFDESVAYRLEQAIRLIVSGLAGDYFRKKLKYSDNF